MVSRNPVTGDKLVSRALSEQGRANFDLIFGVKSCDGSDDTNATMSENASIFSEWSEESGAVQLVEKHGIPEIVKNEKS